METEEIIVAIHEAAKTIATPNWADILSVIVALGAVVVAVIIAFKQNKIAKQQNELVKQQNVFAEQQNQIVKQQNELAKQQNKIAEKQAEIANQQNEIALFDKGVQVYTEIVKICNVVEILNMTNISSYPASMIFKFIQEQMEYEISTDLLTNLSMYHRTITILKQAPFFFPQIPLHDVNNFGFNFSSLFFNLNTELINNPDITMEQFENEARQNFIASAESFCTKYLLYIVECLKLQR